ncbi:uncharacterized protein LOC126894664 [Daktulosphaira vitifoliae]|uniref:uncharacterized protein LOC126894664 n=1 Tax=Daktulosphaira vitifoliae TaxID=58002 RepID=UPI0021AA914D|nr:uncharacterized protein LOC126894664 [Daktulosphaira vitifoliae]
MTFRWVILLALVTTITSDERHLFNDDVNELFNWFDNSEARLGTWRSPEGENDEQHIIDNTLKKENRKRALSFLTHWKPWKQMSGNGRHVIRSPFSSFFPDSDVPSKGNRPVGQPLRWGRRRRR